MGTVARKRRARTALLVFFLVMSLIVVAAHSFSSAHAQTNAPREELIQRMIARINSYRFAHGCSALVANEKLMRAAQAHSQDMTRNDFFGHVNLRGESPLQRIAAQGYDFLWVGENIAGWNPNPECAREKLLGVEFGTALCAGVGKFDGNGYSVIIANDGCCYTNGSDVRRQTNFSVAHSSMGQLTIHLFQHPAGLD